MQRKASSLNKSLLRLSKCSETISLWSSKKNTSTLALQKRNIQLKEYNEQDFDELADKETLVGTPVESSVITSRKLMDINNKPIPPSHCPKPMNYEGKMKMRTAYVLTRMPKMVPEEHPFCKDHFELEREFHWKTKYIKYGSFGEYFEAWKKARAAQRSKSTKKHQETTGFNIEGAHKDAIVRVPDPPEISDEQKIERARKLGRPLPSPLSEGILKDFKPAPRYTDADFNDIRKSLFRKLQHRLYFIVKSKKTGLWKFPDMLRVNPMTLRLSAETLFHYQMKNQVIGHFLSNSPLAHFQSKEDSNEFTYFYSCIYVYGVPPFKELKQWYSDHAWVTRQELLDYNMIDPDYKRVTYDMLYDSGFDTFLDPEEYVGIEDTRDIIEEFAENPLPNMNKPEDFNAFRFPGLPQPRYKEGEEDL